MKWYWSERDIPQIKKMPYRQGKEVYQEHYIRILRQWKHWLSLLLFLVPYLAFSALIVNITGNIIPSILRIGVIILCISLFMGISGILYSEIILNIIANQIRKENETDERAL